VRSVGATGSDRSTPTRATALLLNQIVRQNCAVDVQSICLRPKAWLMHCLNRLPIAEHGEDHGDSVGLNWLSGLLRGKNLTKNATCLLWLHFMQTHARLYNSRVPWESINLFFFPHTSGSQHP